MILGFHVILTAYGFWLPNDPRGSWSDFVRNWNLLRFGKATKIDTRQSVAHTPHDRMLRQRAKDALRYPPVLLTGVAARAVATGFRHAAAEGGYALHACCVLPDHAHLVIAYHPRPITQVIAHLKGRATRELTSHALHPLSPLAAQGQSPPSPWARGSWRVFLDSEGAVHRAIKYVEQNPVKEGKAVQRWSFVVPFTGSRL